MLIIRNAYMIDPREHQEGPCHIVCGNDGRITEIRSVLDMDPQAEISAQDKNTTTVIDASGLIAAPGLVDTHVHFRDPGFTQKEDLHTGSLAAAKGGVTSVLLMANTRPPVDSPEVLEDILQRGEKEQIHIYSAANVTEEMKGDKTGPLEILAEKGAKVLTDDGHPILKEEVLRDALGRAARLSIPVSLHEEDPQYISENGINAGSAACARYGLEGSPREAEINMIRRDVQIACSLKAPLCIQHISTAEGVELVRQARKENPMIRAEATPQHFTLTEDAVLTKGTLAKVNPPLRTEKDRQAIIEGLADGTIDFIATDHAPHTAAEKALPFAKAPSGMIGLETSLSLGIRELVEPGYLTLLQLLGKMSSNPSEYYRIPGGSIAVGEPADLVLFDPTSHWTVPDHFASKSSNSPFIGEELPGVIRATICGGKIIYDGRS